MRLVLAAVSVTAACGRVAFDPASTAPGDGALDADVVVDASPIPPGAVLWLPMDEAMQVTTIADRAGAHVVTCSPLASCPVPAMGVHGGALRFDGGTTSFLTVNPTPELQTTSGYTVAAWVTLESYTAGYTCLISKPVGGASFDSYSLCIQDDMRALFFSATTAVDDYLTGPTIALGEWHHLAMTWDGTTKRGYVDGALAATRDVAVELDASPVLIAADQNGANFLYQVMGALDDVVIYGRALDDTEIAQLAAGP